MQPKTAAQSLTVVFNILSLAILVATKHGFGDHQPAAWVTEAQAFITIVVNWYLRVYRTSVPIVGIV